MKIILCGGYFGDREQNEEVNKLYSSLIEKDKPILFIPIAMEVSKFPICIEWIKAQLNPYGINIIEMLTDIYSIDKYNLNNYSSIFIGGGNTFRLLNLLKDSGAFSIIKSYIENDGIVIGGSAGAIIFGKDIHCTDYADGNFVNLIDTTGFNIIKGFDICCHYTNKDAERNEYEFKFISDYVANGNKVFALPEECSLFVEDNKLTLIGSRECTIFSPQEKVLDPNTIYKF